MLLMDPAPKRALRRSLLHWYDRQRRDLPWRRTRDPYAIWVAEIMLQQTRVAAVLEHYREFLRLFPDAEALARARSTSVLSAWSGLGYYRRARALHNAAKVLVREFGGKLPTTAAELAQLPGVGRYTAAAIASTAFGQPCAVVDGNVERVLTRLAGRARPSAREFWNIAEQLLSRARPGDFNQAMMELGATVCLPSSPQCERCPVRSWCAGAESTTAARQDGSKRVRRRKKNVAYVLAEDSRGVFLIRRDTNSSLMPSMWELPEAEARAARALSTLDPRHRMRLRHSITNTDYAVTVLRGTAPGAAEGRWIRIPRLRQLPLTGLARKILHRVGLL